MLLQITDLDFGKTDAKNEFANDPKFFIESFCHPTFSLDDYNNGHKYFIQGDKGSGKTAILNYIHSKNKDFSGFIYYKKEIDSEMKNSFFDLMNLETTNITVDEMYHIDFENIWTLQLHIFLLEKIKDKNFYINDTHWKKYKKKVEDIRKQKLLSFESISLLIKSKFTRNTALEASSNINFREANRNINNMVKTINLLFLNLNPQKRDSSYYVLIDEVELNKFDDSEYRKNLIIIRDLVIAVNNINLLSKQKRHQIKWIMAIRSEVLSSVYTTGKEINKILNDFGNKLAWSQTGGNPEENGLIKILLKKIHASEKKKGISENLSDSELFKKYFNPMINDTDTATYILQQTFFKPRDIVRLFTEIRNKYGDKPRFSTEIFEGIREDYANSTWDEIKESLATTYNNTELNCIQLMLSGNSRGRFQLNKLHEDLNTKSSRSRDLKDFLENHSLENILENLYIAGVIGNYEKVSKSANIRFYHRGQERLLLHKDMLIHDSIIKIFL